MLAPADHAGESGNRRAAKQRGRENTLVCVCTIARNLVPGFSAASAVFLVAVGMDFLSGHHAVSIAVNGREKFQVAG